MLSFAAQLHALSASLKAFTTNGTMHGVEQCRLACGGLGYSQASGIPKIYVDCVPACTYEGREHRHVSASCQVCATKRIFCPMVIPEIHNYGFLVIPKELDRKRGGNSS